MPFELYSGPNKTFDGTYEALFIFHGRNAISEFNEWVVGCLHRELRSVIPWDSGAELYHISESEAIIIELTVAKHIKHSYELE